MNKKGFTLIELLAVIIILGILMLIAIPSVTGYINNSRKDAYINTARNYIKGATNLVNDGSLNINDTGVTYYIPSTCISLESGGKSHACKRKNRTGKTEAGDQRTAAHHIGSDAPVDVVLLVGVGIGDDHALVIRLIRRRVAVIGDEAPAGDRVAALIAAVLADLLPQVHDQQRYDLLGCRYNLGYRR